MKGVRGWRQGVNPIVSTQVHTLDSGMQYSNKQKLECDKCELKTNVEQDKSEHNNTEHETC